MIKVTVAQAAFAKSVDRQEGPAAAHAGADGIRAYRRCGRERARCTPKSSKSCWERGRDAALRDRRLPVAPLGLVRGPERSTRGAAAADSVGARDAGIGATLRGAPMLGTEAHAAALAVAHQACAVNRRTRPALERARQRSGGRGRRRRVQPRRFGRRDDALDRGDADRRVLAVRARPLRPSVDPRQRQCLADACASDRRVGRRARALSAAAGDRAGGHAQAERQAPVVLVLLRVGGAGVRRMSALPRCEREALAGLVSVPTTGNRVFALSDDLIAANLDAAKRDRLREVEAFALDPAARRLSSLRCAVGFAAEHMPCR